MFASPAFCEEAAKECDATIGWFGTLAVSRGATGFGRNNQIFDKIKTVRRDFRRGAELARMGDYGLASEKAMCFRGDVRGMLEQPLHSWMTDAEYNEFFDVRIERISAYARQIRRALHNAMVGAQLFYHPDPDYPERSNDDGGFPGEKIAEVYQQSMSWFKEPIFKALPEPLPNYVIDRSVACGTGEEVPWTGVWFPSAGLANRSLTFAIKGRRMQPAFRILKTKDELKAEGAYLPSAKTVAVATASHPFLPSVRQQESSPDLLAKAGQPCPRAGVWQTQDVNATEHSYGLGEPMANLGSAYGLTVWRWHKES